MESIRLDVHAHLVPVIPDKLAALGIDWDPPRQQLTLDGHALGLKPLFQPDALIAWMDSNAIATAWISIPPPAYRQTLDPSSSRAWCSYVNDGLAGIATRFASRLAPLVHLPVEHPALANEIAVESVARNHARFSMATGAGNETMLSSLEYEPLWQTLHEANAFLFLHPGEGCDPRLDKFYLHNLLGNPTETAIAASHLALSGVFKRFHDIRFCLAHGGGTTAAVAGRLTRGLETARPGLDVQIESPLKGFRHVCVDCIVHDSAALDLAERVHGEDNILFGSDWPFPIGMKEPHTQLASLTKEARHTKYQENPARFLCTDGR